LYLNKQIGISKEEVPKGWSLATIDFVNQCIQRKPLNRLGFNGPEEVKEHPFLKDVNWRDLLAKKLTPPFIPKAKKALKVKALSTTEEEKQLKEKEEENVLLRRNSVQNLFNGYHYDIELEYKDLIEKETEKQRMKDTMLRIIKVKPKDASTSVEATLKTEDTQRLLKNSNINENA